MEETQHIEDNDCLSRLLYEPAQILPGSSYYIRDKLFEFPSNAGRLESLVWRKKCLTSYDVNSLGCEQETLRINKASHYRGYVSAIASQIRNIRLKNGHKLLVFHSPEEGDWHVHIHFCTNGTPSKPDKSDVRAALEKIFVDFVEQSCPPQAAYSVK